MYRLPEKLRARLAKPLGRLFTPVDLKSGEIMKELERAKVVVSVGDRVTEELAELGRIPDVQIVDGKENRRVRATPDVFFASLIRATNPAGTVTDEAIDAVMKAFKAEKPARVLVDGEEDLLAIAAVIHAPFGARVCYGQPNQGIVVVKVTKDAKARNRRLLRSMEREGG